MPSKSQAANPRKTSIACSLPYSVDRDQRIPAAYTGELLRVNQVADLLNIRPATVRAWLFRRKLPYVRVGRCVRVPLEALNQLIARNTVPAKEVRS